MSEVERLAAILADAVVVSGKIPELLGVHRHLKLIEKDVLVRLGESDVLHRGK